MKLEKEVLFVEDLAKLIGLPANTIRKLARKGEIPSVKIGRRYMFTAESIDRFLNGR